MKTTDFQNNGWLKFFTSKIQGATQRLRAFGKILRQESKKMDQEDIGEKNRKRKNKDNKKKKMREEKKKEIKKEERKEKENILSLHWDI